MGGFSTAVPQPSPAALDIRPPQQTEAPLDAVLRYRALQQEQQLRAQQLQLAGLQTQGEQMNLDQRRAINQSFMNSFTPQPDGSVGLDTDKFADAMAKSGHGEAILPTLQAVTQFRKTQADLKTAQQSLATAEANAGGRLAAAVKAANYSPEVFHTLMLDSMNQGLINKQHFGPIDAQIMQAYQDDPSGAKARALITPVIDQMIAGSPQQQEVAKGQAEAAKNTAQAKQADLETQLKQSQLEIYKTLQKTPEALHDRVAATIDPVKYPALFARAFNEARNAPDLPGLNAAIEKYAQQASDQEKTIAVETNPQVNAARVQRDVATARATAPIKIATSVAEAKALRQGDNPAVANVPPAAVQPAISSAIKLDSDYLKANEATEAMGKFLDLAEQGNKAASSNLPLVGVETLNAINGIKRINSAEISQYQGAGDLLDRIKGKLGKLATGKQIPQDVLDDIRQLHQTLGDQAYKQYTDGLAGLNTRYRSQFGPTVGPPNIRKPAAASQYSIGQSVRLKNGQTVTIKAIHPDGTFDY